MAYQTGTANTASDLISIIELFATTNGFLSTPSLDSGGNWISKSGASFNLLTGVPGRILGISRSGTTATVTMSEAHGLTTGNSVTIRGSTLSQYNGTFTIVVTSPTAFTYTMSSDPGASSSGHNDALAGPNTVNLAIYGSTSADGSSDVANFQRRVAIPSANWPITYYLYYNSSPDFIVCVLHYNTNYIQPLFFGNMVKVGASAYTGGQIFFAPHTYKYSTAALWNLSDTIISVSQSNDESSIIPFGVASGATSQDRRMGVKAAIDGHNWDSTSKTITKFSLTDSTISSIFRSPNTWNNQAHLVPMQVQFAMLDSLYGYIGYLEHIRLIRIDNYELGDVLPLGSDTWHIYPWRVKDTIKRNGPNGGAVYDTSGTLGFAVRYTV